MKSLITITVLLCSNYVLSQHEKSVESKVSSVTIYLQKAQVTRIITSPLESGKTNLIISGLSAYLEAGTIQLSGTGSATILGIRHQQNFTSEFPKSKSIKALNDSLNFYQRQLKAEQNKKEILEKEEQLMLANQKFNGANNNLTISELKTMTDYFRVRLTEILNGKTKADNQIKYLNDHLSKIHNQIREQSELLKRNTSEVIISLEASKPSSIQLELKYMVSHAGWSPMYDIRSIGIKEPVILGCKANVFQSTGENWEDVSITLSSGNPNLSGTKPELSVWGLDIIQPYTYQPRARGAEVMAAAPMVTTENTEALNTMADQITLTQASLNTEFIIGSLQTIPSGPKPLTMDIRQSNLLAEFTYAAVPKLEKDAFLLAYVTGWSDLNLLAGEANLFADGKYVGKTFIDPTIIKDTLILSLGRDQRITVTREKVKDLSSRKLIGAYQRELAVWKISARNTKNESVKLILEDQIPVSLNSQIEVYNTDVQGGKIDKQTGKVTWFVDLAPAESKSFTLRYEIKYPKDKIIGGL